MYQVSAKDLGHFDAVVCGGGIAGVCAAVSAARNGINVLLVESSGCLGGTVTEGLMGNLLDVENKQGIIQQLQDFLNARNMTCVKSGKRTDENGKNLPGPLIDEEDTKYFLDKICAEAGVKVLFHSLVCAAEHTGGHIHSLLLCTECGNYSVNASIYIDATGNGSLAALAGCRWECGEPENGRPHPASMDVNVTGLPDGFDGTARNPELSAHYVQLMEACGIKTSGGQGKIVRTSDKNVWNTGFNFVYDVMPDDIESLSRGIYEGRKEAFEVVEAYKQVPGFEGIRLNKTNSHLGIREGRRILGVYRLRDADILEGRRFEDGVVLVTAGVDVHKLSADDTPECSRGYRTRPFHIPYRCLLPLDSDNLLLAGRCISGDFYPFSAYRMIANMAGTGEAAGYAATLCIQQRILPAQVDGKAVSLYMKPYLNEPAKRADCHASQ